MIEPEETEPEVTEPAVAKPAVVKPQENLSEEPSESINV